MILFIVGASTSFFDTMTNPLIACGLPIILSIAIIHKNGYFKTNTNKDWLMLITKLALAWFVGYALNWAVKILLANLFFDLPATKIALNTALFWVNSHPPYWAKSWVESFDNVTRWHIPWVNWSYMFGTWRFAALAASLCAIVFVVWNCLRHKEFAMIFLLAIGIFPVAWYTVLSAHSYVHAYFTYRMYSVTIYAICTAVSCTVYRRKIN